MKHCPACGQRMDTINSVPSSNATYRRKKCRHCGHRITTYEFNVDDLPRTCIEGGNLVRTPREAIEAETEAALANIMKRLNNTQ